MAGRRRKLARQMPEALVLTVYGEMPPEVAERLKRLLEAPLDARVDQGGH